MPQEVAMKRFLILLTAVGFLALAGGPSLPKASGSAPSNSERATVNFDTPTKLMNVVLKGEYVFIHDQDRMEAGEDCTYVYESHGGAPVKLVLSFHCHPVARAKVSRFTIRSIQMSADPLLYEIQEFQFGGSKEAHQVPARHEAVNATVDMMACCD
jgi:hypothetical protein